MFRAFVVVQHSMACAQFGVVAMLVRLFRAC